MNFLAFDLETARVPNGEEWRTQRPLGISCYAFAWRSQETIQSVAGYGKDGAKDGAGVPQPQMSRSECQTLVQTLTGYVEQGFTLLTWNGLGFDFDILAEESGLHAACCALARAHLDMMFHFFCLKGYPLGLDATAKGMGLAGKIAGMDGSQAPLLWQQGGYENVLAYVTQDVTTTLEVATAVAASRQIRWQTRGGKANRVAIRKWLTVREALTLPLPKATWIRKPMSRATFTAWMEERS